MYIDKKISTKKRYTLGKDQKLKSRKLIGHVFEKGKIISLNPLRIHYLLQPDGSEIKAGFTTSVRNFKRAVERNRIKRILRESYRLERESVKNGMHGKNYNLYFFIVYTGKELPESNLIREKLKLGLQKLISAINENIASNS